jgi:hypothetical protein
MSTNPGSTLLAMAETSFGPEAPEEFEGVEEPDPVEPLGACDAEAEAGGVLLDHAT